MSPSTVALELGKCVSVCVHMYVCVVCTIYKAFPFQHSFLVAGIVTQCMNAADKRTEHKPISTHTCTSYPPPLVRAVLYCE